MASLTAVSSSNTLRSILAGFGVEEIENYSEHTTDELIAYGAVLEDVALQVAAAPSNPSTLTHSRVIREERMRLLAALFSRFIPRP